MVLSAHRAHALWMFVGDAVHQLVFVWHLGFHTQKSFSGVAGELLAAANIIVELLTQRWDISM